MRSPWWFVEIIWYEYLQRHFEGNATFLMIYKLTMARNSGNGLELLVSAGSLIWLKSTFHISFIASFIFWRKKEVTRKSANLPFKKK